MKHIIMTLLAALFICSSAEAQTKCETLTPPHKTAVKHKSSVRATTKTTSTITACRMVPFQVCTILPDRRSVSCYTTTDGKEQTQTGATTIYGPTGPMPGEPVHFKVRTVVIKGKDNGAYCKRNAADNATECYHPGYLVRDEDGYYSYGEVATKDEKRNVTTRVTAK